MTKPDGAPRQLMDAERLADLNLRYSHNLRDGLVSAYELFWRHRNNFRGA